MTGRLMRSEFRYVWPDTYLRRRDLYRVGFHIGWLVAATGLIGFVLELTGAEAEWLADGYGYELGLSAVGAALASATHLRSRANARLFEQASVAEESSPQPLPADLLGMELTAADADSETRRLLTLSRRAIPIAVLWALVLPLGIVGMVEAKTVIDNRIEFTLFGWADLVMFISLLATAFSAFLLPMSLAAIVRWRRKYRSVSAVGWRPAQATARFRQWARFGPSLEVRLGFGDGAEMRTSLPDSTSHGIRLYRDKPDIPVWVGGTGPDMVVLFPYGRLSRKRYAVPVSE